MTRVDDFDAFYHASRTSLLHQTYALIGDTDRAATAVEHAFAHAWSQWRKVCRCEDPDAWVRGEAWRVSGGRLTHWRPERLRARFRGTAGDRRPSPDLESLRGLSDMQRRVVVLHHVARLPIDRVAREVGVSHAMASDLLSEAEQVWAQVRRGHDTIATSLSELEADVAGVRLPRATSLRRAGQKRHRKQTLVGVVTATALLAGGGLLIVNDSPAPIKPASSAADRADRSAAAKTPTPDAPTSSEPSEPQPFLLDQDALLTAPEMGALTRPRTSWTVRSTTDGTTGEPIYALCQQEPFADPDGNQALLRRFQSDGANPAVSAVQVIEESRSDQQGSRAFDTMQGWYARCADEGVQLMSTMKVSGLGDEARAFRLRKVGQRDTLLTVGMVRTGPIITAVVASTRGAEPVAVKRVLNRAAVSVERTCLPVSGDCSTRPKLSEIPPLPTQEYSGFLAAYDLPSISGVTAPWVGTDPTRSLDNPAATPCERAKFGPAQKPRTRVFVLPTAKELPRRFGLAETVGTFASRRNAHKFVERAEASARSCPDRELSASVPNSRALPDQLDGRIWRFEFEVNEGESVYYRVGLVRSGRNVALMSMSPSASYDVAPHEFGALMVRASQRLSEAG